MTGNDTNTKGKTMNATKTFVEQATEDFRLAGLRLMKAEANLAKGYTLHRLEEKVAAQQACDRAKKRLAREIERSTNG
jgi:hypothetical protein